MKTATTIDTLVSELTPVPFYKKPLFLFVAWNSLALIYFGVIIEKFLRVKLSTLWSLDTPSAVTVYLLIGLFLSTTSVAFVESIPGFKRAPWFSYLPYFLLVVWLGILLSFYPPTSEIAPHGLAPIIAQDGFCARYLFYISLAPMVSFLLILRLMAPTKLAKAAAFACFASAVGGALCLEFFCPFKSPMHRIYGHWGIVIVLSFVGLSLGRKLLRW